MTLRSFVRSGRFLLFLLGILLCVRTYLDPSYNSYYPTTKQTGSNFEGSAGFSRIRPKTRQDNIFHLLKQLAPNGTCKGKGRLLEILHAAHYPNITEDLCKSLPEWKQVAELYGEEGPIILGLETCAKYRSILLEKDENGTTYSNKPMVRVAGLYHSGTNAWQQSLAHNLQDLDGSKKTNVGMYCVPWGKHVSAKHKWSNTWPRNNPESKRHVLPVILVRDPYRWMKAMCKTGYDAEWEEADDGRCPNLVMTKKERRYADIPDSTTFVVNVTAHQTGFHQTDVYNSLADLWSEWNRLYLHADYPRLMIRFEDTLFHAEQVMQAIQDCVGVRPTTHSYEYLLKAAKKHGSSSSFVQALQKYGTDKGRLDGLSRDDLEYARTALDPKLMHLLHYPQPPQ